jgi:hypothetical protein
LHGSPRWAAFALTLLASCASAEGQVSSSSVGTPAVERPDASDLPGLPRRTLPGYVVRVSTLDAAGLSLDALDPSALEALLVASRFEVGKEVRFTAPAKPLTAVVARVLRFESSAGAAGYLDWLRTHGQDLLGSQTQAADSPGPPDAIAFSHDPCLSCSKDTFWYFAAWTRGSYAVTLRLGGPRADSSTASPLAEELDARVRDDG